MTAPAPDSFIGIDLGGTQLRAARVDAAGSVQDVLRVATDRDGGPEAVIEQMDALVERLRRPGTFGIGVGVPCALDGATGIVPNIPALPGWDGIPLADRLGESSGLPTLIENDAKVATLAEWKLGAGRDARNFAFVTVSTGIGGGVVVDGVLVRGFGGLAGEVGHTKIADQTAICSCGRRGCWEAIASGTALGRQAATAVADHPESHLARMATGRAPTGEQVHAAALAGCATALGILRTEGEYLGWGFANIQHFYSPELIVVGGGVAQALDLMIEDIERAMQARLLPSFPLARVCRAQLGDEAGLLGAAMLAREAYQSGSG